jgi:glucan phosphoethanolaminetransferase (alkaline phosphatase superfamily)
MSENDNLNADAGSYVVTGSDAKLAVQRGKDSWNYFYVMFGFALAIESNVIAMFTPIVFPWNIILFVLVFLITGWAVLFNERFQDRFLRLKEYYEKGRPH